jgi:hypothetical protein
MVPIMAMNGSKSTCVMWVCIAMGVTCAAQRDRLASSAIAVAPQPTAVADSSRQHALALTTRLATGRGFEPFVPGDKAEQGWTDCFTRSQFYFCDKVKEQEIQFLMWQYVRFSPEAESFRRELMDSLRATFGASSVRECAWLSPTKGREAGCKAIRETPPERSRS